jgi:hypothetical protein
MKLHLITLKIQAHTVALRRGHTLEWTPPYHNPFGDGESRSLQTGTCTKAGCDCWAQVNTNPLPNGIDIGGPAVAVECPHSEAAC